MLLELQHTVCSVADIALSFNKQQLTLYYNSATLDSTPPFLISHKFLRGGLGSTPNTASRVPSAERFVFTRVLLQKAKYNTNASINFKPERGDARHMWGIWPLLPSPPLGIWLRIWVPGWGRLLFRAEEYHVLVCVQCGYKSPERRLF